MGWKRKVHRRKRVSQPEQGARETFSRGLMTCSAAGEDPGSSDKSLLLLERTETVPSSALAVIQTKIERRPWSGIPSSTGITYWGLVQRSPQWFHGLAGHKQAAEKPTRSINGPTRWGRDG